MRQQITLCLIGYNGDDSLEQGFSTHMLIYAMIYSHVVEDLRKTL